MKEEEKKHRNCMINSFVKVCHYSKIQVTQPTSTSTTTTTTTNPTPSMVVGFARNLTQIRSFPSSTIKVLYNPIQLSREMIMKNMKNKEESEDGIHDEGWEIKPLYSLAGVHSVTTLYDMLLLMMIVDNQ